MSFMSKLGRVNDKITDFWGDAFSGGSGNKDQQEQDLVDAMEQAKQMYAAYRQQVGSARQRALQNRLSMFDAPNQQLADMYGRSLNFDMQNPLQGIFDSLNQQQSQPSGSRQVYGQTMPLNRRG